MEVVEEEGWNEFVETVDWASPLDVYGKMVGLIREHASEEYEDVKVSNNDDEVVIYTHEGQHVGTKRKVLCIRAKSTSVRTRKGQEKKKDESGLPHLKN